ncbi:MAG: DUF1893 domain-containing protein [Oscillospiraceae bacterium]|jgi:hypothetical protein|nr:DUF1893 domain-containing protein [Oscillospiraceae bacterium]
MTVEELRAVGLLESGKASCAVITAGGFLESAGGKGVAPLLGFYENNPQSLKGAFVADKIIGRAASVILVLGGVKKAYGEIMSEAAFCYLKQNGVCAEYKTKISRILNRSGNGICPLEESVLDEPDADKALKKLKDRIQSLKAQR